MDGEREEVPVAEALGDLGGPAERLGGRGDVALEVLAERLGDEEVAMLDAVALLVLEQPLRPAEPADRRAELTADREVHADPEPAPHGAELVARVEMELVRPLEAANPLVVAAEHRRRAAEQLDVARFRTAPRHRLARTPRRPRSTRAVRTHRERARAPG